MDPFDILFEEIGTVGLTNTSIHFCENVLTKNTTLYVYIFPRCLEVLHVIIGLSYLSRDADTKDPRYMTQEYEFRSNVNYALNYLSFCENRVYLGKFHLLG